MMPTVKPMIKSSCSGDKLVGASVGLVPLTVGGKLGVAVLGTEVEGSKVGAKDSNVGKGETTSTVGSDVSVDDVGALEVVGTVSSVGEGVVTTTATEDGWSVLIDSKDGGADSSCGAFD